MLKLRPLRRYEKSNPSKFSANQLKRQSKEIEQAFVSLNLIQVYLNEVWFAILEPCQAPLPSSSNWTKFDSIKVISLRVLNTTSVSDTAQFFLQSPYFIPKIVIMQNSILKTNLRLPNPILKFFRQMKKNQMPTRKSLLKFMPS